MVTDVFSETADVEAGLDKIYLFIKKIKKSYLTQLQRTNKYKHQQMGYNTTRKKVCMNK